MKRKYSELKKAWEKEDLQIRGDIARYLAMSRVSIKELAAAIGLSQTTMYARLKNPETFTLSEYRLLKSILYANEEDKFLIV